MILGSIGNDRLRGTSAADVFQAFGGDDTIKAGDGVDTLIIDGSIWDYDWRSYSSSRGLYWSLEDTNLADGNTGIDELWDVELIQFNDATLTLGQEMPTTLLTEIPDRLVVTAGEDASFDFVLEDLDDRELRVAIEGDIVFGRGSVQKVYDPDVTRYGENSIRQKYTFSYDGSESWGNDDVRVLAEGEERVMAITLVSTSRNIFLDGFNDAETGEETGEFSFDLVVVGVNDAPTLSGVTTLDVVEGTPGTVDLSLFGDDIDSDDDGSTLNYTITSAVSRPYDAPLDPTIEIDGAVLRVSDAGLPATLTSDETLEVTLTLAATDRHGAVAAGEMEVAVTLTGVDNTPPPPDYLTPGGEIDDAELGLSTAETYDFGTARVWNIYISYDVFLQMPFAHDGNFNGYFGADGSVSVDMVTFSDGNDTTFVRAGQLIGFNENQNIYAPDGQILRDGSAFDMGHGADKFVFRSETAGQSVASFVDVVGGTGEDSVVFDLNGGSGVLLQAVDIDTGMQSDRVILHLEADQLGWMTADVATGSGHDWVDARLLLSGEGSALAAAFFATSFNLGSGDDRLSVFAEAGTTAGQRNAIDVNAGDGDDTVVVDLAGLGDAYGFIEDTTGLVRSAYPGGLDGTVIMGAGSDHLTVDLPRASAQVQATLLGDGYYSGAVSDHDILELAHLQADSFSTSSISDYLHGDGVRVVHGQQTIDIFGFEEILLGDGSAFFVL